MTRFSRVLIFAPHSALGGSETLALRVAHGLADRSISVIVKGAAGGWLQSACSTQQIPFSTLTETTGAVEGSSVVLASAKDALHPALRALALPTVHWLLHPLEFAWIEFKRIYRVYTYFDAKSTGRVFRLVAPKRFQKLRRLYEELVNHGALISMSDDCTDFTNRFLQSHTKVPELYLPRNGAEGRVESAPYSVRAPAYFGRIEDFKVASIKRLIQDTAKWRRTAGHDRPITLFGYGSAETAVKDFARKEGVELEITGKCTIEQVACRARECGLLIFTMGLSGVDLLEQGVATAFLPIPKHHRDHSGGYSFFSDLPSGCIGSYSEFLSAATARDFQTIMDLTHQQLWHLQKQDQTRVFEQHSLEQVLDRLLGYLSQAKQKANSRPNASYG